MGREKTFAEILVEAKAAPKSRVVGLGGVNADGDFFDPSGNLLVLVGEISPERAQELVAQGALLAFEGCGCGGSAGCAAEWFQAPILHALASKKPRFVKGYGSPTWIDLWESDAGSVVYAHGDVEWGDVLA